MPQRIVMPSMGMYTEEGVLSAWLRPSGVRVEAGEAIVEITTEKVTFEVPSPAAGILHHAAETGANLSVEALLGYVLAEGETLPSPAEPENSQTSQHSDGPRKSPAAGESSRAGGTFRASPAAKRLAAQHGIDLNLVKGTGPGGRIVEADVLAKVSQPRTRARS
jgi:pyruvate/2-oxoglutarate dehydrogenase complex dihydrolipoamide acyltransferase (E2) component